jgi:hypothetical protein
MQEKTNNQWSKRITILAIAFVSFGLHAQTSVTSPADFLGYQLGDKFTSHHQVARYTEQLHQELKTSELISYGITAEGRPLQLLVLSHPENMNDLASFKKQHLDRVQGGSGIAKWDDVAVVWLSYNVHGNEAVCTEAAIEVMYKIATDAEREEDWLKRVIVLIDPCLNPDGHDRYTNWFNQYASLAPNADPLAYEHDEPWPGGRPNHYLFDLNRDWAWQTQSESQMRSKVYHEWMPHVHCDYHEMGYNSPYYFAPAAEPFHESITDWQRAFQEEIGNATAQDFDARGQLYYTRESFDLLYPSYGDTYPIYNGSIGMTYEQGGSGSAGVLVRQNSGDSLSLNQRIENHVSSSFEALFTSARLSTELVSQMAEFFELNRTKPSGRFHGYHIPINDQNISRARQLATFLERHNIECEAVKTDQRISQAWEYGTGETRTIVAKKGDLLINAHQTHSGILNVLFDPDPVLTDSLTYDITTWSIPYAYGLRTFGLQNLPMAQSWTNEHELQEVESAYGWAIQRNGIGDSRFTAQAMQAGIRLRTNAEPIVHDDASLSRGSLLILKADQNAFSTESLMDQLQALSDTCDVELIPLISGHSLSGPDMGSDDVWLLKPPRVACLSGESVSSLGAGESWWHFEQELGYPITMLNNRMSTPQEWIDYDVLIIPSGWYESVDEEWLDELSVWIQDGGRAIAISSALNLFADRSGWRLQRYDDDVQKAQANDRRAEERKSDCSEPFSSRNRNRAKRIGDGSVYAISLDLSHPLAWGYSDSPYYTLRSSSRRYAALENGWNVGTFGTNPTAVSGFVGSRANLDLEGSLVFGVASMGQGSITYLADNPLFRGFWEHGKLLFDNAVFFNQY